MLATVDNSVLQTYFKPIVGSESYSVGVEQFPVKVCFLKNIATLTPPVNTASTMWF